MSFVQIHFGLSTACLIFSLLLSGMSFWALYKKQGVTPTLWGVLVTGEVLFLVQAAIGVVLMLSGGVPARGGVHFLYGIALIVALPAAYAFTRGRESKQELLVYGMLGLFLVGVSFRAIDTALSTSPFG